MRHVHLLPLLLLVLFPGGVESQEPSFDGLWETSFGRMRLVVDGDRAAGRYQLSGGSTLEGTVEGRRFAFRYVEPAVRGEGWFERTEDGGSFAGSWRADGSEEWLEWTGRRVVPEPGVSWLVVFEASWEEGLLGPDYSFGSMLGAFFARHRRVKVRHRRFGDAAGFSRFAIELAYLAEPVALVVAAHGDARGVLAGPDTIGAAQVGKDLAGAPGVFLVHFSSCGVLAGEFAAEVFDALPSGRGLALSGYASNVDWSASALLEMAYLDLVLGRGLAPSDAAALVKSEFAFAGDEGVPGSPFGASRFRFASR
ncbi:MAG: hypothetical protein HY720_03195 [Planctomycetes bacterium]|nr:hypothetical protein [Planctomycetota bacterium]